MKSSVCYVLKNIPCFNITTVLKETFPCKGKSIIKRNLKSTATEDQMFHEFTFFNCNSATVGYILGVARYTDVTVRYVPRFDTISVQQGKTIYYARVLFLYFEQTVVQITIFFHLDVKILIINTNTIITFLDYV